MSKTRLEAFSDGVLAIIITIMVLELKAPHGGTLADIWSRLPDIFGYALSFTFVGIYWSNHHHLFQAVQRVNGATLWANLHLLFWLSLVPFSTDWIAERGHTSVPIATYGINLLGAAIAYFILTKTLSSVHERDSAFVRALGSDFKGKISIIMYATAIALSFVMPWMSYVIYAAVALTWFVPDRRFEKAVTEKEG